MNGLFKKVRNDLTDFFQSMKHPSKPNTLSMEMKELQSETVKLCWDCALMIEKYNFTVFMRNEDSATSFNNKDMKVWREVYYPTLIKTNIINDTQFYDPQQNNPNLGIGADGIFLRHEYCNVRYQLYLYIYQAYIQSKDVKSMLSTLHLHRCINNSCSMIISYISQSEASNPKELHKFAPYDLKLWKNLFYPVLVETSLLNDYSPTYPITSRKKYRIGDDGIATCWEFQLFVSEAYRFLLLPIYIEMNYTLHE